MILSKKDCQNRPQLFHTSNHTKNKNHIEKWIPFESIQIKLSIYDLNIKSIIGCDYGITSRYI